MSLTITPAEIVERAEASGKPGLLAKASGWDRIQLGDVARIVNGAAFHSAGFNSEGRGMPLIRIRDVTQGSTQTWFDGTWEPQHLVRHGDVLVGMDGDFRVERWHGDDALLNQRVCRIDIDESKYNARFLPVVLQGYLDAIWQETSSVTVKHLSSRSIAAVPLPCPSLEEQRRIVDLLEDHLSGIDAAEAYLDAAKRRLEVMVSSVLLELIPDESRYPDTWKRVTVADAGSVTLGRQRHPDWHRGPNMKPYLRVANVFEDRIDTSDVMEMHWPEETFERFKLRPGDVLLNEGQTPDLLGRSAIYGGEPSETAFTNSLIRFKVNEEVLPEFALLVFRRHMRAGRFKRESRITTNIAHLSAARLKPIEFPIPPSDEQHRIVAIADERLSAVKRLAVELATANAHRSNLRRTLLAAAFSGRLTSSDTDLSVDEEMVGA